MQNYNKIELNKPGNFFFLLKREVKGMRGGDQVIDPLLEDELIDRVAARLAIKNEAVLKNYVNTRMGNMNNKKLNYVD